jgi:hypothetical protein
MTATTRRRGNDPLFAPGAPGARGVYSTPSMRYPDAPLSGPGSTPCPPCCFTSRPARACHARRGHHEPIRPRAPKVPEPIAAKTRVRKSIESGSAIQTGLRPIASLNHFRADLGIPPDSARIKPALAKIVALPSAALKLAGPEKVAPPQNQLH